MLREDGTDALKLVDWWLMSSHFGGLSAVPTGPPEWPYPGGLLRQPARLIDAVTLISREWSGYASAKEKREAERAKREAPTPARRPRR